MNWLVERVIKACRKLRPNWFRMVRKRICCVCQQPIKRTHKWTAKPWHGDRRPRHRSCVNPTWKTPPPISVEKLGPLRITDWDGPIDFGSKELRVGPITNHSSHESSVVVKYPGVPI